MAVYLVGMSGVAINFVGIWVVALHLVGMSVVTKNLVKIWVVAVHLVGAQCLAPLRN